jgi:hypothetical protein
MLGMLLVALTLSGCMSDARREIEADRLKAHTEPLDLDGPKGQPVAHIGIDGSLTVGDEAVALDAAQHAAVLAYREATLKVVDLSLISAEKYVHTAVPRFLFDSVLHLGTDGGARSLEKGADKMVHSPPFCDAMETMREKQEVMVAEVPRLRSYTHVTTGDIQDCRVAQR